MTTLWQDQETIVHSAQGDNNNLLAELHLCGLRSTIMLKLQATLSRLTQLRRFAC